MLKGCLNWVSRHEFRKLIRWVALRILANQTTCRLWSFWTSVPMLCLLTILNAHLAWLALWNFVFWQLLLVVVVLVKPEEDPSWAVAMIRSIHDSFKDQHQYEISQCSLSILRKWYAEAWTKAHNTHFNLILLQETLQWHENAKIHSVSQKSKQTHWTVAIIYFVNV